MTADARKTYEDAVEALAMVFAYHNDIGPWHLVVENNPGLAHGYLANAREALAAALASLHAAGWRVVPAKATIDMWDMGAAENDGTDDIWDAMIAAAPPFPPSED